MNVNYYNFAYHTLILLLNYPEKCRHRSLAVYNNEFKLNSAGVGPANVRDYKFIENLLLILSTCQLYVKRIYDDDI